MFAHRHRRERDDTVWFERTVDDHKDRLYTFAYYFLRDTDDAADVTQEVLIRLWKHRASIERTTVASWLRRVCRNACIDRARQRKTRQQVEVRDVEAVNVATDEATPETAAHVDQLHQMVLDRLDRMEEPFRTLIILREIQGMPYAEIAAATDLPLNTVKVYLQRARRRLRDAVPVDVRNEIV